MKYQLFFIALLCLHLLTVNSKTLNSDSKKFFQIIAEDDIKMLETGPGGDVNGDGYADILISGRYSASATLVYGGPTDNLQTVYVKDLTPKQGFRITSSQCVTENEKVTLTDLNKDGYADIVLRCIDGNLNLQKIYVVFGASSLGGDINLDTLTSTQGFVIDAKGIKPYGQATIRPAGDFNGDGYQDLVLQFLNNNIYVVYGGSSLSSFHILNMTSQQGLEITNKYIDYWAWYDINSAGDVNNDGYADLIVSIGIYLQKSAVFVIYGGKSLATFDISKMTNSQGFKISITDKSQPSVGSAGDVNKDGYADMIIGDEKEGIDGAVYVVYGSKTLSSFDISELSENRGIKISGHPAEEYMHSQFGVSVSSAGDFNKDGYSDFIIGAPVRTSPQQYGHAFLIYGGKSLSSFNVKDITDKQGFMFTKPGRYGYFVGKDVFCAGDVNNDGYDDVLLSSAGGAEATVLFGGPSV